MDTELLKRTGSETWNFLRTSYRRLFMDLLKVKLVAAGIIILAVLISVVLVMGLSYLPEIATIPIAVLIGIIVLVGIFLGTVAASVGYNVVDSASKRREMSIKSNLKRNMWPMLRFILATMGIYLVIFVPFVVVLMLVVFASYFTMPPPVNVLAGTLMQIIMRIVLSLVAAVAYLFLQFAIFELILSRRGAIESYKKSFNMVKKRPLETIVFTFALWAVDFAISLILLAVLAGLFGLGLLVAMGIIVLDSQLIWIVIALGIVPLLAIMFVYGVIQSAVLYSAQYVYWNKAKLG